MRLSMQNILELANALSIASSMRFMSQEQAAFVWKDALRRSGLLPAKGKNDIVKEEV